MKLPRNYTWSLPEVIISSKETRSWWSLKSAGTRRGKLPNWSLSIAGATCSQIPQDLARQIEFRSSFFIRLHAFDLFNFYHHRSERMFFKMTTLALAVYRHYCGYGAQLEYVYAILVAGFQRWPLDEPRILAPARMSHCRGRQDFD